MAGTCIAAIDTDRRSGRRADRRRRGEHPRAQRRRVGHDPQSGRFTALDHALATGDATALTRLPDGPVGQAAYQVLAGLAPHPDQAVALARRPTASDTSAPGNPGPPW